MDNCSTCGGKGAILTTHFVYDHYQRKDIPVTVVVSCPTCGGKGYDFHNEEEPRHDENSA